MRHILLYIILGLLLVVGCGQKEGPVDPIPDPAPGPVPENVFKIDCNSKTVSYIGDSFPVNITSSGPWKVYSSNDWINTEKKEFEGSCSIEINVEASYEKEERTGQMFFFKDSDTLKIEIIQEARPFIELAKDEVSVDGDGGTFDILFLSSTAVTVDCQDEWIRLINVSSGNILSFEVLRNHSAAREGGITVSCFSDSDIFKVLRIFQGEKIPHPALSFEEGIYFSVTDENGFSLHPVFVDMTDLELVWSSSAPEIATVDETGNIDVHSTGSCVITARNIYHNVDASITLDIKLKAKDVSIMFGNQDVVAVPISSRFTGEKIPVVVSITPSYAYAEDLVFYSSDSSVADFENNILNCKKSGKTEIYVESAFNDIHFKFTVLVIDAEN